MEKNIVQDCSEFFLKFIWEENERKTLRGRERERETERDTGQEVREDVYVFVYVCVLGRQEIGGWWVVVERDGECGRSGKVRVRQER